MPAKTALVALALAGVALVGAPAAAEAANAHVTRVTLATGGLAAVEGVMDAPSDTMSLAIERALVADVLRTFVVTGDTAVRSIDLEAAESVGERSVTGRLLNGDLADPATILQSLIGQTVAIKGGATQLAGQLLAFAFVTLDGGEKEGNRPALRIAVATENGSVSYATFETEKPLAIEGGAVSDRVSGVVPALQASVDDGRRELVVRLDGEGTAGFNFVVPTTVWRPSYRAILGESDDVALQGWATLENTTGLDWNDIDLRLAVGTPVAYRQDVYSPLRTVRPDAPFEVGRTAEVDVVEQEMADAPAPVMMEAGRSRAFGGIAAAAAPAFAKQADLVTGGPAVASSAATIFPVAGAIDLAAGRTLNVPFLDGSQDAERIVYIASPDDVTPMDALDIAFAEDATVPGGLIAVYDQNGFVGDARFGGADSGERTILPFARSADVNARLNQNRRQTLTSARIADGSLRVRRDASRQIVLALEAAEPVTLVTDVPVNGNETVTVESNARVDVIKVSESLYRVRATLEMGATRIDVTAVRPILEQYMVSNIPTYVIEEVLSVGGAVDEETAAQLRSLAAASARIAEIDRRLQTLEADIADLRQAVAADRDNLEAIDAATPEGARVRERIIGRTEEIDAMLGTTRDLRRERLEAERALRNP
ncbi:hypothetical protein RDV64_10400 [Acuticoccus sp. MNP-M23]|uniref:DUF4139 domain-containing protein n=1 Tax=Acuticoccus sp. MNP-M23 TaxID=3072793 RepID=UPI00281626BD|nr:DUF4139 domain-containing protein [Acuticoccus sp. MNP-M23]WMS44757.1 hypothetical protein RDV64_10400 [Acuticoccus sp. MNP-M23]